jgi:hypothetical protein
MIDTCHTQIVARRAVALVGLALGTLSSPLSAQRWRPRSHQTAAWSLLLDGGGSYAISDLEIAPGTDQNGGWTWDAGLRLQLDRVSLGAGYERMRFDVGPIGSGTTSGIYVEPRLAWGQPMRGGVRPYLFARGERIVDYDFSSVCCSIYPTSSNGRGWLFGGGFGVVTAPVGYVRFDLSAGVSRLSGESTETNVGTWKSAGPLVGVRLGASVPLVGRR